MVTGSRPVTGDPFPRSEWSTWHRWAEHLAVPDGVHRPSAFSALLASTLTGLSGAKVVDAGCGAGLITLAALLGGAGHVVAVDRDPRALAATRRNVESHLGAESVARLTLRRADFKDLTEIRGDVLAVNPPQRPSRTLSDVEPGQRHLHTGGGAEGLDALDVVLAHAGTTTVRATAAAVLPMPRLSSPGWTRPEVVAGTVLPMHPAWHTLTGPTAVVHVWDFRRRTDAASACGEDEG